MSKSIVVCSDGTGNTSVKGRGTNVFKLFESIDLHGHRWDPKLEPQVAIYDDGVGTESFKPVKIFAGATGYGLSRNVKHLYKEVCRIYDPGDRIFLFGFSRGAFTVRTLAGLILTCGVINARDLETAAALEDAVTTAYGLYRRRYRTWLSQLIWPEPRKSAPSTPTVKGHHLEEPRIAFIGVWDTVDAVGLPFRLGDVINTVFYRFKFPDRRLNDRVERAYHALSIDDARHSFHPLLWDQSSPNKGGQMIEQVWFAGAHSNVGGGYPKQGVSLVALDWMMQKAQEAGLRFVGTDRALYREHANVDDKLYDSRAGLGMLYRWKPRDIAAITRENGVAPAIHLSVLERIAHGTDDYGPGNLAPNAKVVFTPTDETDKDAALSERARQVELVLRTARSNGGPLLARVGTAIAIGRASYYLFLLSLIALLVAGAIPAEETSNLWTIVKNVGRLLGTMVISPLDTLELAGARLASSWVATTCILFGLLTALVMAGFSARRMSTVFSQYWHGAQQRLRKALKLAAAAAKDGQ